jgi:hypothetical protein
MRSNVLHLEAVNESKEIHLYREKGGDSTEFLNGSYSSGVAEYSLRIIS